MGTGALVVWTEKEFGVGISSIDDQHRALFDLINKLFMAMVNRDSHTVSAKVLTDLLEYTRTHFSLEEQLLEEAGYKGLAEHRNEHRVFIIKVQSLTHQYVVKKELPTLGLIHFLRDWLSNHIKHSDRAYAEALSNLGNSKPWWKPW